MKNGRIHETDAANLKQLGEFIENTFKHNLLQDAEISILSASNAEKSNGEALRMDDYDSYFVNDEGIKNSLSI